MNASVPPAGAPEAEWLARGRALALQGHVQTALALYEQASEHFPASSDVRIGLAGLCWQAGQHVRAESLLREWLTDHGNDATSTFLLVDLLRQQGRLDDAAETMHALFAHGQQSVDTVIRAVETLDDYGRQQDAAAICEAAITNGAEDPRLHAYAGMLAIQLGQFERTRRHYDIAMAMSPDAVEWNIPLGLAGLQRYRDTQHPDFAFFRELLQRAALSDAARSGTLFALGKAYDDVDEVEQAVQVLRQANALMQQNHPWSRKLWKRSIEARLGAPSYGPPLEPADDWTPVFIVGVPRSGTTLLAERLARHPQVRARGELGWLQVAAQRVAQAAKVQRAVLEDAAALYATHARQGEQGAHWIIDKQPLNLLHVDLILTLWPHARIIYCERNARDTALSLWMQSFHDRAHDYAYDFDDIAAVIHGCRRLMAHWAKRYSDSIHTVRYETFVAAPDEELTALEAWLRLPSAPPAATAPTPSPISTASVWQARQPVYTRSAGRWQRYATYLPELLALPEY
jgi:tetratricopeptide (TPR) repeat protein